MSSDLGTDWEWDGFRRCQVKAARDGAGKLVGEGIMVYENKDVFKVIIYLLNTYMYLVPGIHVMVMLYAGSVQ